MTIRTVIHGLLFKRSLLEVDNVTNGSLQIRDKSAREVSFSSSGYVTELKENDFPEEMCEGTQWLHVLQIFFHAPLT